MTPFEAKLNVTYLAKDAEDAALLALQMEIQIEESLIGRERKAYVGTESVRSAAKTIRQDETRTLDGITAEGLGA